MKSICTSCQKATNHKVICEKSQIYDDITGWWEKLNFQIIQCQGCDTISFRKLYTDIANQQSADETGESGWTQELFPKRTVNTIPIKSFHNTPQNIKRIYRETIDAFNNGQEILCSAGLRAIIEGLCNNIGITEGEVLGKNDKTRISKNLDGKINALSVKGYLLKNNAEILHELRFMGNYALHELSSPSSAELKMAIDIIEHTINNLFEFQHKATEFKKEIAKRKIDQKDKK